MFIPNSCCSAHSIPRAENDGSKDFETGECTMLKTFAAIGLSAALALSPLAALAEDAAAPAATEAAAAPAKAPMKAHKSHKAHKAKHHAKAKDKMAPAPAEAPKS